jgi:Serine dehydrogenase proteinase
MLLRRHCGGFVAIIPRHAKSAATLLTLGADEIIMNDHAELGPLDVQMYDADREERLSGLDEVQSLERLQAFAMDALDRTTWMLWKRTRKRFKTLIPLATEFVTKLTHPMFMGIDVVRYTQMSRALKVAEEYAKRLLRKNYGDDAQEIAKSLVEDYSEHEFPIYPDEAVELGLKLAHATPAMIAALEKTTRYLPNLNVVGRIV